MKAKLTPQPPTEQTNAGILLHYDDIQSLHDEWKLDGMSENWNTAF